MVKDAQNIIHDPTLASDILQKLTNSHVFATLITNYSGETQDLVDQLTIDDTDQANEIPYLLDFIEKFPRHCDSFKKLEVLEREHVNNFFNDLTDELQELNHTYTQYPVDIHCALDCYTLSHTTVLIETLEDFLSEPKRGGKKSYFSETSAEASASTSAFYKAGGQEYKAIQGEINLAQDLKCACEGIREQIGSPETKPRGLIIDFMHHLCEAISRCQELSMACSKDFDSTLQKCIEGEIKKLRKLYPDLAQAGEDLQKAFAHHRMQNP